MKSIRVKFLRPILLVVVAIIPLIAACGGASRNDQGASFSALNWVMCDDMTEFLSGQAGCILSGDTLLVGGVMADINSISRYEALNGIGIKVQNNLTGQTMRVQRVYLEYYIPGANVQPPATSVSAAAFLRANCAEEDGAGDEDLDYTDPHSTIPAPLCGGDGGNQGVLGFNPVTEDVREFITMNMDSMPALPFTMIVTAYAQGVSSSGNTYETNSLDLDVTWDKNLFAVPYDNNAYGEVDDEASATEE